jgi:hypothetical protein
MMFLAIVRHSTTRPSSRNWSEASEDRAPIQRAMAAVPNNPLEGRDTQRPPLSFMRSVDLANETVYLAESK